MDRATEQAKPTRISALLLTSALAMVALAYLWLYGMSLENAADCDTFESGGYDLVNTPNPPDDIAAAVVFPVAGALVLVAVWFGCKAFGRAWGSRYISLGTLGSLALLILVAHLITTESSKMWNDCSGAIEMDLLPIVLLVLPAAIAFLATRLGRAPAQI